MIVPASVADKRTAKFSKKGVRMKAVTEASLPVVALRGVTGMPEKILHFDVSRQMSLNAVEHAMKHERPLVLITQKNIDAEEPGQEDLYTVGCLATIKQTVKLSKQVTRVLAYCEKPVRLLHLEPHFYEERVSGIKYLHARVSYLDYEDFEWEKEAVEDESLRIAMKQSLKDAFTEYMNRNPKLMKELGTLVENIMSLTTLIYTVAAHLPIDYRESQEILETMDYQELYNLVLEKLLREIRVQNVKEELQRKVKEKVDKNQRDYILREELKAIREELGEDNVISDAEEFEQKLAALDASDLIKEKIAKEIKRFKSALNSPAEAGVSRTYVETMLEMPWNTACEENLDTIRAKRILDGDHYGLEKVKERIVEFLAVKSLTNKGQTPILCLVGPPGTGKTSIARSLATATERPYIRISLGGVRDEAEIRGHRKTYVGAMPGRIAAAIKNARVKNPLLLLDEIDKVGNDSYHGDTFSALLEVLDSEQNHGFQDRYLEVPLDLSEVLFVTTANTLQTIPRPLLDRMEVIELSSYTENEKVHIAMEHLVPKQLERHGLKKSQLVIDESAILKMARNYTREAGVRQLERKIGEICRKCAKDIIEKDKKKTRVTKNNISKYLGNEIFTYNMANEVDEVGIVRGLAWTQVGGDTLQIEVNVMPGSGMLHLTGQLGDVMKESAEIGVSYIRTIAKRYDIEDDYFEKHDIHVHIPAGATPKDGPSAGITMATAILSAVTEKKVRADVAMTGEITLRGRVLPIGGLKEKLLAAKNAGIKTVLVPKQNIPDVEELDAEITEGMKIIFVSQFDEVIKEALV